MQIIRTFKFIEETEEYVHVKKAINLKDETIFDFMIHLPNDKLKVIKNSFLAISKLEVKRYNDINSKITEVKFELIEKLLKEVSIEGFNLSFLLE